MSSPLVSIIINNYNYARFLRDAIDSALNQTYSNTEVIVVDDGSTDASPDIIKEYGEKIIPIVKENGGQASAINTGFAVSLGEVIIFLDSDDALFPTAVENILPLFQNQNVVKVHWPLLKMNAQGISNGETYPRSEQLSEGNLLKILLSNGPSYFNDICLSSPTSGNAFKRDFLNNVFPIPETQFRTGGMDYYLYTLAPIYGEIKKLLNPQTQYRLHGANDTSSPIEDYINRFFVWYENICEALSLNLQKVGIHIDSGAWPRNSWFHRINESIIDIQRVVPEGPGFILVDEEQWRSSDLIAGRKKIPFMEKNGEYWGHPPDDQFAIREIERQRENGASSIIFAWPAFWWLDHYAGMRNYLRSKYECILDNERLIGFSLK